MIYQILLLVLGAGHAQSSCIHGNFDLSNTKKSSSKIEGNVDICWNGVWLPVLYSTSSRAAGLICQHLGFSGKDYQTHASTRSVNARLVNVDCGGEQASLKECNYCLTNSYGRGVGIRCVDPGNNTIPGITSATVMDGGAVSLKWTLVERYDLDNFMVECSSVNHMASLLVNNQTFSTELRGLLPHANYNCCVSALFDGYRTQSCATSIVTDATANSGLFVSASLTCNTDTIGGVLGFIIIILLLLLVLAIVAFVYPCLIRPRIQNHKTLSRLSDFLDRKVYNYIYVIHTTTSANVGSSCANERQRNTSTSTHVSTVPAVNRTESVPAQDSDTTQSYEPLNYYSPIQSQTPMTPRVTNTTSDVETPRVYEPVAYTLPSTCLDQISDTTDHVYAVLEEPIN